MKTLFGPAYENAVNPTKQCEKFEELKGKLAQIGIVQGNPKQEAPIYFDCCIGLTRVSRIELSSIPASPDVDYCSSFEDVTYSGDDLDYEHQNHSTQPYEQSYESRSQKRRIYNEQNKNGKRPCRDSIDCRPSKQGLSLQGLEDDSTPDFRATLVFTVINNE
ncbi:hypothetical protein BGZ76_001351 [Entomortierella beljakovae]|nr:hypothetical protein BGZ76_001351 [Entomortierella beljakovae]